MMLRESEEDGSARMDSLHESRGLCPQGQKRPPCAHIVLLDGVADTPSVAHDNDMPRCAGHGGVDPISVSKEVRFVADNNDAWEFAALPFVGCDHE